MANQKIQGAQRDFSFGEVDVALKRSDEHPARKGGLRQCVNMRILNSKGVQNRPGRSALFPTPNSNRIEEITMSPGNVFKIAFGAANIIIFNSAGAQVASFAVQGGGAALPWTALNLNQIVYAQLGLAIYITFPGMKPQVVSWDGVTTWSIADYAELVFGGQKRTWFYRISPQGITLLPSARTGNITLTASAPMFKAGHVGTRVRYISRQILITGFTDSQHASATVQEPIPGEQDMTFSADPTLNFSAGDVVFGSSSGSRGVVLVVNSTTVAVQLTSSNSTTVTVGSEQRVVAFTTGETLVGPAGSQSITSAGPIINPTIGTALWDEEVMNSLQGYPASCFVDQFRLGFCNFPSVSNGIGWSAINSPFDQYVLGATVPNGALFELTPDKVQIFYVTPGPESSEFVFCDHKLYYIKIDAATPLKPGSVSFQTLSGDGAARVQPRLAQDVIFYVNSGGNSVMAVVAPGAYYRPFNTDNLCEFHSHLFSNITALAAPNADGTFNERYVYALNANGSLVCGKYSVDDGKISGVGWGPWSGVASLSWIAAQNADVLFTSIYFGATICEILDDTQYLDGALFVNALPSAFTPPGGKGPLWWIPSQSVTLIDQVTRVMGTYQIDASGFLIPQFNGGEDLTVLSLVAGQPWTSTVEPFCPDANPGPDAHQRMFKRRVARFAVYVIHSTGFTLGRLFAGPLTPTSPALGTLMNFRRFPAWNQDDDATKPPPSRETVERIRPLGRAYDPRVALIKDTPGPLQVLEMGVECTI